MQVFDPSVFHCKEAGWIPQNILKCAFLRGSPFCALISSGVSQWLYCIITVSAVPCNVQIALHFLLFLHVNMKNISEILYHTLYKVALRTDIARSRVLLYVQET